MSIEAVKLLVAEMEYVLSCINEDKIPFDGDDFHEALRLGRQAIEQAQRQWVELTDDEMLMIYGQDHEGKKYNLGRMVQQALKEKNT